jgi:hypothetical protein
VRGCEGTMMIFLAWKTKGGLRNWRIMGRNRCKQRRSEAERAKTTRTGPLQIERGSCGPV